jgi:hypothetical protein
MLGEVRYTGGGDASYGGESADSALSLGYYRQKALEFQQVLSAMDEGRAAAIAALNTGAVDPQVADELQQLLGEYDSKAWQMRMTGEAINAGAAAINAAGGRFPVLSIPQSLGLLPALPFAAVAAFGTAATLVAWGVTWLSGVNDRLRLAMQLDAQTDPEARAALAREVARSDAAIAKAQGSPVAWLATPVKWLAIGVGAFLVWRAVEPLLKGRGS